MDVYDTNSDHFGVSVTGAFVSGERAQKAIDVCVSRYDRGSADIWSFVSFCQRERVVVEFILCSRCFFFVMYEMGYCFFELSSKVEHEDDRLRFFMLGMVQATCWSSFPLVPLAKEFDFITCIAKARMVFNRRCVHEIGVLVFVVSRNIRVIDSKAKDELEELHLLTEFQRDFFLQHNCDELEDAVELSHWVQHVGDGKRKDGQF